MYRLRIETYDGFWMLYDGGTPYAKTYTLEAAEEIQKAVEAMFPSRKKEIVHGPVYAWPRK